MNFRLKCCILLVFLVFIVCEGKYAYVLWEHGQAKAHITDSFVKIPELSVARATYSNEINETGWAFLEIHTHADVTDEQQAYAAGFIEGFLTHDLIWMHWQNMLKGYCYNKTDICGLIEEYVDKNEEYIAKMVNRNQNHPYWYQMKLYFLQIEGVAAGYRAATSTPYQWLTIRDIVWINMLGDLDELALALSLPKTSPDGSLFPDHCTGLVKLLPDMSNLYVAHATWNSYQSMLRIQKMYVLHFRMTPDSDRLIPGYKMAMSSYPGFVQIEYSIACGQSTDDFYITSAGLVTAETTIGNSNRTLFEFIDPVGQVLEYARVMVANRLATSGKEWVEIFRKHNSGTYNNQWYIVDYKRFRAQTAKHSGYVKPGLLWVVEQLPGYTEAADLGYVNPGLLWIVEQLPGYTEAADLTEELKAETYFPSFNIPYFPSIFNLSGGWVRVETFGDWFGYRTNPRYKIIQQQQSTIRNLHDMYTVMRYNDFKHDPLSRCETCDPPYSACNAIAARNDLNPANGTFPFRALGHRSHGATDVKITSAVLYRDFGFLSVSSPTYNISRGLPPFLWSTFDLEPSISHEGHPDAWLFSPLLHQWEWQ